MLFLNMLYVLTDDVLIPPQLFYDHVEQTLMGGAEMIQFRTKSGSFENQVQRGLKLHALCRAYGVPMIVNDSVLLAAAIHAEGVHLGRDDGSIADARNMLGKKAQIGISCYSDLERANNAETEGADYVAFGSCFLSNTKPEAPLVSLEIIRAATESLGIPVCCIGGIDASNVGALIEAGADMIAVCSAVFGGEDVRERTVKITKEIRAAQDRIKSQIGR